jgi:hypothetical protein
MPWSQRPTSPIVLKDGRTLVTLRDAGKLFAGFSEPVQAHKWTEYAVELLLLAAENSDGRTVKASTRQVERALFREGMI